MDVLEVAIGSLVQDPSNARKHSDKNLAAIKGSLARFGQQKPIVVSKKNIIIAGNGTFEAARSLGWDKIKVVKTDLTGSDLTAFGIADNRTSELAEWDRDVLGTMLQSLREDGFEIGDIGFDVGDLDAEFVPDLPDDDPAEKGDPKLMLTVLFEDDAAQQDLFIELRDRGFKVKA
jgi:ParB-like chromosome segregation protein Spo0J